MKNDEYQKIIEALKVEEKNKTLRGLRDIPSEVYHSIECPGLSRSDMVALLQSSKHWLSSKTEERKTTAAMEFGIWAHAAVLEPGIFAEKAVKLPEFKGTGSRAAREAFEAEHKGKYLIDSEDMLRIGRIIESVYSEPNAEKLLVGMKEKTFFRPHHSGVLCKARPDCLVHDEHIVDLKFTSDASEEGFLKSCAQLEYEIQVAYYLDALELKDFTFLAVESHEPFDVAIYQLDADSIDLGRKKYERAIENYLNYQETKKPKGYSKETKTLRLPAWKFYEESNK